MKYTKETPRKRKHQAEFILLGVSIAAISKMASTRWTYLKTKVEQNWDNHPIFMGRPNVPRIDLLS